MALLIIIFIIFSPIASYAIQQLSFSGHDDADDVTIVSIGSFNISTRFFDLSNYTMSIDRDTGKVNLTIETYGNISELREPVWYQIQSKLIITRGSSSWMYLITALVNLTNNENATYYAYLNTFTPDDRDTFNVENVIVHDNKIIIIFNISKTALTFSGDTNWSLYVQLTGHTMSARQNGNMFYVMDDASTTGIKKGISEIEQNNQNGNNNNDILSMALLIVAIILIVVMFSYIALNYR